MTMLNVWHRRRRGHPQLPAIDHAPPHNQRHHVQTTRPPPQFRAAGEKLDLHVRPAQAGLQTLHAQTPARGNKLSSVGGISWVGPHGVVIRRAPVATTRREPTQPLPSPTGGASATLPGYSQRRVWGHLVPPPGAPPPGLDV